MFDMTTRSLCSMVVGLSVVAGACAAEVELDPDLDLGYGAEPGKADHSTCEISGQIVSIPLTRENNASHYDYESLLSYPGESSLIDWVREDGARLEIAYAGSRYEETLYEQAFTDENGFFSMRVPCDAPFDLHIDEYKSHAFLGIIPVEPQINDVSRAYPEWQEPYSTEWFRRDEIPDPSRVLIECEHWMNDFPDCFLRNAPSMLRPETEENEDHWG